MDFLSFELAKKLKEKGFSCQHPIAMYNEIGDFCTLTTSADFQTSPSGYKCRCYYDYDDFDEHDFIAPTISQVLKWLREEEKIYLELLIAADGKYICDIFKIDAKPIRCLGSTEYSKTYEQSAIAAIEFVLNNLI